MLLAIGGFGGLEIAIILLVVILIFGPSKLPQLGAAIGKMFSGFKREMKEIDREDGRDKAAGEIDVTPANAEEKR